ncbi:MAG: hypothetical protein IJ037_09680 [Clostridia bacterium]|nr:hypothetical protein [Clostridia bacterium]
MLRKLFRYDFKAIARTQVPALFALLCITVIGCLNAGVLCVSASHDAGLLAMLSASGFVLTVTTFAGIIMVMSLLIYVRFYKSMVTAEAYTTFTLPAKPSQILTAKFLSAIVWNAVIMAAYIAAVLLLALTMAACIDSTGFAEVTDEIRKIGRTLGINGGTVILFVLSAAISSASQILQIFTAILTGASLVRRHKALAAVGMIFVINFAVNLAGSAFGFVSGNALATSAAAVTQLGTTLTAMLLPQTVLYAVIAVVCWLVCVWVMRNKVNLE